jgi:hypothetical protein
MGATHDVFGKSSMGVPAFSPSSISPERVNAESRLRCRSISTSCCPAVRTPPAFMGTAAKLSSSRWVTVRGSPSYRVSTSPSFWGDQSGLT